MNNLKSKSIKKNRSDSTDSSSSSTYYERRHVKFEDDDSNSSSRSSFSDNSQSRTSFIKPKFDPRKVQSAYNPNRNDEFEKASKLKPQRNSIAYGAKASSLMQSLNQIKPQTIQKRTQKEIEMLKQRDPIFAKRHKQFLNAKICNKAPKFDHNDYFIKIVMPKSMLKRSKTDLMDKGNVNESDEPKNLKAEMEKLDARVKQFIRNFATT